MKTLSTAAVVLLLAAVASAAAVAHAGTPVPQFKVLTVARGAADEVRATARAAIIDAQQDVEVGNLACPKVPSTDPESWNYRIERVVRQVPQTPSAPRVCVMMVHERSSQHAPVQTIDEAAAFVRAQAAVVDNEVRHTARVACSLLPPPRPLGALPPQCA